MKVYALICDKCGDLIYSRARHDYRNCSCGSCGIDGGFEPVAGRHGNVKGIRYSLPSNVTKRILYDDWNKRIDKYGLIKNYKIKKLKRRK